MQWAISVYLGKYWAKNTLQLKLIIKVYYVIIIIRLPNPLYLVYVSIIYCNFLLQKSSVWDVEYWRMAWVMQIHPSSFSPSDIYSLIIFWRNIVDVEGLHYTTRLTRFTQNLSVSEILVPFMYYIFDNFSWWFQIQILGFSYRILACTQWFEVRYPTPNRHYLSSRICKLRFYPILYSIMNFMQQ